MSDGVVEENQEKTFAPAPTPFASASTSKFQNNSIDVSTECNAKEFGRNNFNALREGNNQQLNVNKQFQKGRNCSKKYRHPHPYKPSGNKRRSHGNLLTKNQHAYQPHNYEYTENCYALKDIGNIGLQDRFLCSLYITSYDTLEETHNTPLNIEEFINNIKNSVNGKVRIQKTVCGIVVKFTKDEDLSKVLTLRLQEILGSPIQVARFGTGEYKCRYMVLLKDVPWCISNLEIHHALKDQGIRCGRISRNCTFLRIEILNRLDMHRLIEEGLNFFNCTTFNAVVDNGANHEEPEIVQCFKCQGFCHTSAHCQQNPRCVRCGENHDVEYCPRPRNKPICCHCRGPHHAACKSCPVRIQLLRCMEVDFSLVKNKGFHTASRKN